MNHILWLLKWTLRAAIFFTLFAFALNNQQDTTVHFFFGNQWQAPQVLVVLTAFAVGVAAGVIGMVPWWLQQRRKSSNAAAQTSEVQTPAPSRPADSPSSPVASAPVYADGL